MSEVYINVSKSRGAPCHMVESTLDMEGLIHLPNLLPIAYFLLLIFSLFVKLNMNTILTTTLIFQSHVVTLLIASAIVHWRN